ncbi:hypothetical protein J3R30DRAFT_3290833, partial [Lentinula aciculospora]
IGDFGSCTVPQIQFATGFDNRKETSFEPVDLTSYPHGSAQGIDIITQFMCDQLVNACGADATAKATCASAKTAADTATAKTGAQADKFNAVFGIQTDFAAVPVVSDQGVTAANSTVAASTSAATDVASATAAASSSAVAATSAASGADIGDFGSCSVPQIQFGVGFDGRRETAFEPVDQTSYNHGSADNIAVITDFICNTLTNSCGADATAKATCATAQAAAAAGLAQTGDQADKFNAVFGVNTQFAQVPGNTTENTSVTTSIISHPAPTISPGSITTQVNKVSTTSHSATAVASTNASSSPSTNLQTFVDALGNIPAPPVFDTGNGEFLVEGNSSFDNKQNALARSCDVQHNDCGNAANADHDVSFTVNDCDAQEAQCKAIAGS